MLGAPKESAEMEKDEEYEKSMWKKTSFPRTLVKQSFWTETPQKSNVLPYSSLHSASIQVAFSNIIFHAQTNILREQSRSFC